MAKRYAGGVVVRVEDSAPRVLIVTARRSRKRWVLPKGRVEPGESPDEAAVREVREESGVSGRVIDYIGDATYWSTKGRICVAYYLIEHERTAKHNDEGREIAWCTVDDAIHRLTYAAARRVLLDAHPAIVDLARRR